MPGRARARILRERGLLHDAFLRREEHVAVLAELAHRQDRVDALALVHLEQVHDGLAAARAAALRHLVHLDPVELALVREAEHVVVRVRDEELLDEVVFLRRGGLLAAAAALLRAILVERLRLDVARLRKRHHDVLRGDEIFDLQVLPVDDDLAAAGVAELAADLVQLVGDDLGHALGLGEDVEQVLDRGDDLAVLGEDLVLLEPGEALELHLEDALRLHVGRR
jgi:hypothetical protein